MNTDPRPIGGTHDRTGCQGCGGAWQHADDGLSRNIFGWAMPPEVVMLCDTCGELFWHEGIGQSFG